ncbi:MAG TPA: hypothetical protein VK760_01045 [Candidatus Acidoferrales bacterium]|jgi:hypothetical protein|nr:hypothetical protein [Candidatus Acidoferrales bacterium]
MNKTFAAIALAAVSALALSSTRAVAAPPNAPQMQKIAYMIGKWDCKWTAGPSSGTLVATFTPVMNGAWLQETEAVESGGKALVQTTHFTGYDPATKHWMHLGPNSDGTYEVAQSEDLSVWKTLLPAGASDGKLERPSDTEYIISEQFQQDGKTLTYANDCKKRG